MAGTRFSTAKGRWAGVGPYYAMFPVEFSDRVIERYTALGDTVIDPFSGRGTAVFSAAIGGRFGIGIELNPVGWVYSQAKLRPANESDVLDRLKRIARNAERRKVAPQLPAFFSRCFSTDVRKFLVTARDTLDWRYCRVDWTLAALLLINLH